MPRPLIFLGDRTYPSTLMRGAQVSDKLVALGYTSRLVEHPSGISQSIVIIIKHAIHHAKTLKLQGNTVLYDVVDALCNPGLNKLLLQNQQYLDGMIVANKASETRLRSLGISLPCTVIYHHWDPRLVNSQPPSTSPIISYVGDYGSLEHGFEHARELMSKHPIKILDCNAGGDCTAEYLSTGTVNPPPLKHTDNMNTVLRLHTQLKVACHISIRVPGSVQALYKPGVKLATAAALNCNLITTPDASSTELLPATYPYIVRSSDPVAVSDMITYVYQTFGTPIWHQALICMKQIKAQTSLDRVIRDYIGILAKHGTGKG